ncbi:hypothetical protein BDV12DRAFT_193257 [Aspergillus spectabilis]
MSLHRLYSMIDMTIHEIKLLDRDLTAKTPVQSIDGAIKYRQALKKHALKWKQLAQTQAAAIEAGQVFIQAQIDLNMNEKDTNDLKARKERFQREEKKPDGGGCQILRLHAGIENQRHHGDVKSLSTFPIHVIDTPPPPHGGTFTLTPGLNNHLRSKQQSLPPLPQRP